MKFIENGKRVRFNIGSGQYLGIATVDDCRNLDTDSGMDLMYKLTDVETADNISELLNEDLELWVTESEVEAIGLEDYELGASVMCNSGFMVVGDMKNVFTKSSGKSIEKEYVSRGSPAVMEFKQILTGTKCVVIRVPPSGHKYNVFIKRFEDGSMQELRVVFDI
jgi:hypothetical protein